MTVVPRRVEVHPVGGQTTLEHRIPAEDLFTLNANLVGAIGLTAEHQ